MIGSGLHKRLQVLHGSSSLGQSELVDRVVGMNSEKRFVQVLDSGKVINRLHLEAAYASALEAFSEGTNISKKLYIEFLLFAGMTRQISTATSIFKVKDTKNFVVVFDGASLLGRITEFASVSKFRVSRTHEDAAAKSFNIGSDRKHLNERMLQKMAVSRLVE
jgi:tRNA threonylcarbamoyladenosine modification (KEOPS) complex Cgi121 subunit